MGLHRRAPAILIALAVLAGAGIAWALIPLPPPRLLLAHGPPGGGATGRTRTILGVEFVELRSGYVRVDRHRFCHRGDLLGRVCRPLGLPWGDQPYCRTEECRPWARVDEPVWIAVREIGDSWLSDQRKQAEGPAEVGSDGGYVEPDEAAALLSGHVAGTLRLATLAEYDYAILTGAVVVPPGTIEFGRTGDGKGEAWLVRPDEEIGGGFFGMAAYRLVWVPDPGDAE